MTAGIYTLALLPPGLTNSAFGFDGGPGNQFGPGNTYGPAPYSALTLGDTSGTTVSDFVHFRVVPSEVDWIIRGSASWITPTNWIVPGTTTQRAAGAGDTAAFYSTGGTVALGSTPETVGSLYFNSSDSFTITGGTAGTLSLSNTVSNTSNIWIDAGLHTISAPLALSGSVTVDAQPLGNAAPADTGLTVSGQISGTGPLIKTGPGALVLSNSANTYSGGTLVNGGLLSVSDAGGLADGSSLTIGASAASIFAVSAAGDSAVPKSSAAGTAAVPEPGTLVLLSVGLAPARRGSSAGERTKPDHSRT